LQVPSIPLSPAVSGLSSGNASLVLAAIFALLALIVGLLTPAVMPAVFLDEGGPVENGTIFLYLASVACVVMTRMPGLSKTDKVALCIVLLSLAAREADLHKAMFGISILKARFYNRYGSIEQIVMAVVTLLPVVLSILWLIRRGVRPWWNALVSRRAPALTLMTFLVIIVLAKAFDRTPVTLVSTGLMASVPATVSTLLQSFEEIFELLLPLLVMLAVIQSVLIRTTPMSPLDAGARDWSVRVHIRRNRQNRYEPHIELEAKWGGNRQSCMIPPTTDFDTPEAGTAHALEWVAAWQRLNGHGRLE
jgi:ABC-type uncharacterized transport system permease subunit